MCGDSLCDAGPTMKGDLHPIRIDPRAGGAGDGGRVATLNGRSPRGRHLAVTTPMRAQQSMYRRGSTGMVQPIRAAIAEAKKRRYSAPDVVFRSPLASPLSSMQFALDGEGRITLTKSPWIPRPTPAGRGPGVGSPRGDFKVLQSITDEVKAKRRDQNNIYSTAVDTPPVDPWGQRSDSVRSNRSSKWCCGCFSAQDPAGAKRNSSYSPAP